MERKVAAIGVGNSKYTSAKRERRERSELARACVKDALDFVGRGLSLADFDAVFFGTVDGFEGTMRPDRSMDSFGQGFNTPVYLIHTGGTAGGSAFKDAYRSVVAGLYDIVLVYGSSTMIASVDAQQILNGATPPIFEQPFGNGALHIGAWYMSAYGERYGITGEDTALIAAKSHKHSVNNPNAHIRKGFSYEEILASPVLCSPIRLYEACPTSSGADCVILASEGKARELSDTPVWIQTVGGITNSFFTGYRDYVGFPMLDKLANKMYQEVGITNPMEQIDYAEVFNPFAGFEYFAYDALGFCEPGNGPALVKDGVTDMGGKLPVNLSGGTLCTNSGIAASVARHSETVLQLMGRVEGGRQVQDARVGLSHSWGGSNGQFHTLAIMARD